MKVTGRSVRVVREVCNVRMSGKCAKCTCSIRAVKKAVREV